MLEGVRVKKRAGMKVDQALDGLSRLNAVCLERLCAANTICGSNQPNTAEYEVKFPQGRK